MEEKVLVLWDGRSEFTINGIPYELRVKNPVRASYNCIFRYDFNNNIFSVVDASDTSYSLGIKALNLIVRHSIV